MGRKCTGHGSNLLFIFFPLSIRMGFEKSWSKRIARRSRFASFPNAYVPLVPHPNVTSPNLVILFNIFFFFVKSFSLFTPRV